MHTHMHAYMQHSHNAGTRDAATNLHIHPATHAQSRSNYIKPRTGTHVCIYIHMYTYI